MNKSIGEKIKELRKELKMTQSELAEPEMTKSMLSHIENGTANPSMKNLQHIAVKLNKPLSYFLDEFEGSDKTRKEESSLPLNEIIKVLNKIDTFIKDKEYIAAKKELKILLGAYDFNNKGKVYADILSRLGACHIELKEFDEGERYINQCCEIYISNMLYIEATKAYMKLLRKPISSYNYKEALKLLDRAKELYSKSSSRDIFLEIELLVKEPPITVAQGDFDKTITVCEKAIALSSENNIYYLTDLCYRNIAIVYLLQGDLNKFVENIEKAKKYVEFTNNKYILARIYQSYAIYANRINKPLEALNYLKFYEDNTEERAFYYYLELSRAKYLLGKYEEAIEALDNINYKENIIYLIDCIYILNGKVLKGLILNKLNQYDKAILYIEEAIKEIEPYTALEYKGFVKYAYKELNSAFEALSEAYSLKEEYEKAYKALKKSNEFKSMANL